MLTDTESCDGHRHLVIRDPMPILWVLPLITYSPGLDNFFMIDKIDGESLCFWPCFFAFATGGVCPGSNDPCVEKPCPEDMQCVGYEASRRPFLCQCPPGKLGECSGTEWYGQDRVRAPTPQWRFLELMSLTRPFGKTHLCVHTYPQNGAWPMFTLMLSWGMP